MDAEIILPAIGPSFQTFLRVDLLTPANRWLDGSRLVGRHQGETGDSGSRNANSAQWHEFRRPANARLMNTGVVSRLTAAQDRPKIPIIPNRNTTVRNLEFGFGQCGGQFKAIDGQRPNFKARSNGLNVGEAKRYLILF
jgi:hypothetical protein